MEVLSVTKSVIRRDILSLFFDEPSCKYYLRQIERLLGHSAGSIRRELLRFVEDGFFERSRTANLVYYSLNTKHPLYNELRGIVTKTIGVPARLRNALSDVDGIESAFIYGSFASGRMGSDSDIDLIVIGTPQINKLIAAIQPLERMFSREINFTIYTRVEFDEKRQENAFLRNVMEGTKIIVAGDSNGVS